MGLTLSMVAPKPRTHRCAEALCRLVHQSFATLPAHRGDDAGMAFPDALRAACAMCALTAPALRAFATQRAEGQVGTSDGMTRAPCDPSLRETREPGSPESRRPSCQRVLRPRQRGKALADRLVLDGHACVALAGTGSLSSPTLPGASCLHQVHRHGSRTDAHQRLGAAMLPPDVRAVMPLLPAPRGQPDGTANNAGERQAATRFMATWRQAHPPRTGRITAESLRAHAPHLATLPEDGCPSLLGVHAGDQASLFPHVPAAEAAGRVTAEERQDRAAGVSPRLRVVHAVPLQASRADVRVHFRASGERGPDQSQPCSGVTDVRRSTRNVSTRRRGGRARWNLAHAPCHTRQN
jgi:hypothetical protein